jgi:hypothetical protein
MDDREHAGGCHATQQTQADKAFDVANIARVPGRDFRDGQRAPQPERSQRESERRRGSAPGGPLPIGTAWFATKTQYDQCRQD